MSARAFVERWKQAEERIEKAVREELKSLIEDTGAIPDSLEIELDRSRTMQQVAAGEPGRTFVLVTIKWTKLDLAASPR